MSRTSPRAALGASLLAAGFLAAPAAQACSGITCLARPGNPGVGGGVGRSGGLPPPVMNPVKVGQGHGGVVSAGAGNGKDRLPKGAAIQVSPPANFRR
ncbi:hypothetical protein DK419_00635 [Methylobacterium terrae]|uniref:Uncharacterized protein n=1 Tax=Methylobacterium terrae TaxID=2202827 RepID=A0A2U8WHI7_9HYPH|nr:hypothetical protein [Methylobacterium terrae]AWN45018.1 hypothetical protein DK419_00635 [Methylobacterium terrae]